MCEFCSRLHAEYDVAMFWDEWRRQAGAGIIDAEELADVPTAMIIDVAVNNVSRNPVPKGRLLLFNHTEYGAISNTVSFF
jgi:hypothetical protein